VDEDAMTALVDGGATAGDLDRATHPFGLATPGATVSTVGVAGFTLGGGIGYLARAHGLASDNLIGADVVTADGDLVHASEKDEPNLLWALRGGGGNFGVVTQLRLRLHRVHTVTGGSMLWPLEDTERILDLYLRWLPEQPRDLYAFFAAMTIPPADAFPADLRLRKVCALVWCNTAPRERSDAALALFRRASAPLVDAVGELPYPALQSAFDPLAALPARGFIDGQCYASVPAAAAADAMIRFGETAPTWMSFTHLYPIDGAAARPANDDTAWPWRGATFAQMFLGTGQEPSDDESLRDWATRFSQALAPYGLGGTYSNFLMADGTDRARASYGSNYDRLTAVKRCYDPANRFRGNVNIASADS
jgi:FAD/FMN-containing dehydrogenase